MENKNKRQVKSGHARGPTTSTNIAGGHDSRPSTSTSTGSRKQQSFGDAPYKKPDGPRGDQDSAYQNVSCEASRYFTSSIDYGGQEMYTTTAQYNKIESRLQAQYEMEVDDSEKAERGNWWQGSLYYWRSWLDATLRISTQQGEDT